MLAYQARRKGSLLDKTDEERSRNIQEIGGLLRRDLGMDGHQRDSVSGSRLLENIHQQARDDGWEIKHRRFVADIVEFKRGHLA